MSYKTQLTKEEICDIIVDNIYAIIQGDEKGVEVDDTEFENEDISESEEVESPIVTLGQEVDVKIIETDENKKIFADYLVGTSQIPPLVQKLLGKQVGDSVIFQGKTYLVEKIVI